MSKILIYPEAFRAVGQLAALTQLPPYRIQRWATFKVQVLHNFG